MLLHDSAQVELSWPRHLDIEIEQSCLFDEIGEFSVTARSTATTHGLQMQGCFGEYKTQYRCAFQIHPGRVAIASLSPVLVKLNFKK